jgi:hypothetical protein
MIPCSSIGLTLAIAALVPSCGASSASQQRSTAVAVHQLVDAAKRSLGSSLVLYAQTQVGEDPNWFTQLVEVEGRNVAVFRLPPTSTLVTDDSVLQLTHRAADDMFLGCSWYVRQPDGTYWMEPVTPSSLDAPLNELRLLARMTPSQLSSPIAVSHAGAGEQFRLSFHYVAGHYGVFDSALVATVGHGLVRQFTLITPVGPISTTTHALLGGFGRTAVSAPPQIEISHADPVACGDG